MHVEMMDRDTETHKGKIYYYEHWFPEKEGRSAAVLRQRISMTSRSNFYDSTEDSVYWGMAGLVNVMMRV